MSWRRPRLPPSWGEMPSWRTSALRLGIVASGDRPVPGGIVLLAGDAGVGKTRLLTAAARPRPRPGLAGRRRPLPRLRRQRPALPPLLRDPRPPPGLELPDVRGRRRQPPPRPAPPRARPPDDRRGRRGCRRSGASIGPHSTGPRCSMPCTPSSRPPPSSSPLLLVVEDLHWADQSTRDLMSFLFTRPFSQPVALVASYRSDDLHRKHPLRAKVAEWSRLQGVHRVSLEPLDAAEVRELVACLVLGRRRLSAGPGSPTTRSTWSSSAPRATPSSSRSWSVRPPAPTTALGSPPTSPSVLLVRLDRLDESPARSSARPASPAARVTHELLAVATDARRRRPRREPAHGRRAQHPGCQRPALRLPARAARRGRLRRPAARRAGPAARQVRRGDRRRSRARHGRRAGPPRQARPRREDRAHGQHPGRSRGRPGRRSRRGGPALRAGAAPARGPRRRRRRISVDRARLAVDTAEALSGSGHPERAAALLAEQLAACPPTPRPLARGSLLAARAVALTAIETEEDPPAISAEAVRLAPDDDTLARARVLAAHAHVLAMFWRHQEAQQVGLDALALADKLNRTDLAAEVITTLVRAAPGRHQGAAARGAARGDRPHGRDRRGARRAARPLPAGPLLPGLGRARRGRALVLAAPSTRAEAAGIEWAPYASGARWHLTWVLLTRGDWDDVLRLTDLSGTHAPPMARAMFASLRAVVRVARGEDVTDELRGLRPMWRLDGALAVHAAAQEIRLATQRGDVAAAQATYDHVVDGHRRHLAPVVRRPRAASPRSSSRRSPAAIPKVPAGDRRPCSRRADRLHDDGHTVLERYADPSKSWGPEGRAWLARLDAELHPGALAVPAPTTPRR